MIGGSRAWLNMDWTEARSLQGRGVPVLCYARRSCLLYLIHLQLFRVLCRRCCTRIVSFELDHRDGCVRVRVLSLGITRGRSHKAVCLNNPCRPHTPHSSLSHLFFFFFLEIMLYEMDFDVITECTDPDRRAACSRYRFTHWETDYPQGWRIFLRGIRFLRVRHEKSIL